jgi:hypothetical protein
MADKDREGGIGRFEIRRGGNKVAEADDMTAARIRGNAEKARYPNEHVSVHDKVLGDDQPIDLGGG